MSRYPWIALTGSPFGLVTVGGVEKNARYMRLEVSSRMRVVIARTLQGEKKGSEPEGPLPLVTLRCLALRPCLAS